MFSLFTSQMQTKAYQSEVNANKLGSAASSSGPTGIHCRQSSKRKTQTYMFEA